MTPEQVKSATHHLRRRDELESGLGELRHSKRFEIKGIGIDFGRGPAEMLKIECGGHAIVTHASFETVVAIVQALFEAEIASTKAELDKLGIEVTPRGKAKAA
jgi:hypothetical protein